MDYRALGNSGLQVSAMTLGTMTFGGKGGFAKVGDTDVAGARRQLDMAIDAGINIVDTANMYSAGASEEILGEAIKGRRDQLLIATKVRFTMAPGPNGHGLSRRHVIEQCEASLRRLGVDHIDLFQAHEWDGLVPVEETLAAFDTLVQQGKVRYIGCSNFTGWQLMKSLAASDRNGWSRYVSQQIHYTLQAREAEYELLPIAVDQGVGAMIFSPLAGGLLSGKFRRNQPAPTNARKLGDWDEPPVRDAEVFYDLVELLVELGQAHGVSAAQVAIAWLLTRPGISTVVIGARTDEQLTDNLAAAHLVLSPEDLSRLEQATRPPLIYPYWHQQQATLDRLSAADRVLLGPYLNSGA
ncbi:MAG: aldo/keto reductase [Solirubrobacteraceae bacterium]|nr:aldo/keto reductase [Solirubrobacteraceae bacterium]